MTTIQRNRRLDYEVREKHDNPAPVNHDESAITLIASEDLTKGIIYLSPFPQTGRVYQGRTISELAEVLSRSGLVTKFAFRPRPRQQQDYVPKNARPYRGFNSRPKEPEQQPIQTSADYREIILESGIVKIRTPKQGLQPLSGVVPANLKKYRDVQRIRRLLDIPDLAITLLENRASMNQADAEKSQKEQEERQKQARLEEEKRRREKMEQLTREAEERKQRREADERKLSEGRTSRSWW